MSELPGAVTERIRPHEVVWLRQDAAVDHHGHMTRPLIGITSEMAAAGWDDRVREAVLLPASYAWAVERAGCVPVMLPPAPHHAADLAAGLDGVVFSDGADIDAQPGGTGPHGQAAEVDPARVDPARDAGEFALMRAAIGSGLPVLAIGRGMRVLNAVRGGSVAGPSRDGNGDGAKTAGQGVWAAREVRISPGSRLGRLLGPSLTVPVAGPPDGRRQGVDRLGSGLTAVAWADDEAVEAVELAGNSFAIGMQWHPEQGEDIRVFEGLRAAAAGRPAAG
jgi:putative glutamine amidotransferase